jgi:hypothetical protein
VLYDQNRLQDLIGQMAGHDPIVRKRGQLQTDKEMRKTLSVCVFEFHGFDLDGQGWTLLEE